MAAVDGLEQVIEQYRRSVDEVAKGNPEPQKELVSHREDVTLANPLGPPARGWEQVDQALEAGRGQDRRKGGSLPDRS